MTKINTVNVKCWGGMVRAYADAEGVVRVWDSVAGHYTTLHSLTPRQVARVRKLTIQAAA